MGEAGAGECDRDLAPRACARNGGHDRLLRDEVDDRASGDERAADQSRARPSRRCSHPLHQRSDLWALARLGHRWACGAPTVEAGASLSFDPDDRHYAIYQAGNDLIAVKLTGWLDGSAVCLPRTGSRLVPAESGAGFLGLWKYRHPSECATPPM